MNNKELPNLPSELIKAALEDFAKIRENPLYRIDMMDWHHFDEDENICIVCFAGAMMSCRLNIDIKDKATPGAFSGEIYSKLKALNHFRQGSIAGGLRYLTAFNLGLEGMIDNNVFNTFILVPEFHINPEGFVDAMQSMVDYLKSKGV